MSTVGTPKSPEQIQHDWDTNPRWKVIERTYTLDAQDDGGTVVTVREDHTGPLAGLLGRTTPDLNPSFRQFCAGLKARAEGKVSRPAG